MRTADVRRSIRWYVRACIGALVAGPAVAAGEVSQLLVDEVPATPLRYSVDGRTYTWGLGTNQVMRGFVAGGIGYGYADTVTRVELRTDDIADVATGNPCGVFVQRLDGTGESLAADYPSDGSGTGECDMPALLASRIVNRGALDLFSNVAPDAKNIERADFVFDHGTLAPFAHGARALAGHVVGEKRGNNPVRIAAILELDVFGQPASYGPLIRIDSKHGCTPARPCYAETDLVHEYSFFQNARRVPQGFPSETGQSVETVAAAFVDLERLGLHAGQRYYGFSLFGDDVDRNVHVLTDPATFPDDTSDDHISLGDGADIHGGLAGYFVADELNVASGRVYLDEDGDGAFGDGDAGIADIGLTLYADTNGDGAFDPLTDEALSDSIDSDPRGSFQLPGLEDGSYFVVLHEGDPDLPGGLTLVPGSNPRAVYVSGADVDGVDFPFSNGDAPAGGDDAGAGQDGNVDGGQDGVGTGATDGGTGAADAGADGGPEAGAGTDGDDGGATDGANADGGGEGDDGAGSDGDGPGGDDGSIGGADAGEAGGDTGDGTDGVGGDDGGTGGDGTDTGFDDGTDPVDGGTDAADGDAGAGADAGDAGTDGDGADGTGAPDGAATAGDGGGNDGSGPTGAGDGTDTAGGGAGEGDGGEGDGGVIGAPDADDSSTNAVADSDATDQGVPVTVDVLANDTDAVGEGLTIVAASDSPDATVEIVEVGGSQQVRYVPDFGFFGTDTFMYTVADGDGTEATGTVSVAVNRFSDIDGNGLNDFDECGCTDLTLETGVNGSGIGALSAVWLALLGVGTTLALSWRRARGADS